MFTLWRLKTKRTFQRAILLSLIWVGNAHLRILTRTCTSSAVPCFLRFPFCGFLCLLCIQPSVTYTEHTSFGNVVYVTHSVCCWNLPVFSCSNRCTISSSFEHATTTWWYDSANIFHWDSRLDKYCISCCRHIMLLLSVYLTATRASAEHTKQPLFSKHKAERTSSPLSFCLSPYRIETKEAAICAHSTQLPRCQMHNGLCSYENSSKFTFGCCQSRHEKNMIENNNNNCMVYSHPKASKQPMEKFLKWFSLFHYREKFLCMRENSLATFCFDVEIYSPEYFFSSSKMYLSQCIFNAVLFSDTHIALWLLPI